MIIFLFFYEKRKRERKEQGFMGATFRWKVLLLQCFAKDLQYDIGARIFYIIFLREIEGLINRCNDIIII